MYIKNSMKCLYKQQYSIWKGKGWRFNKLLTSCKLTTAIHISLWIQQNSVVCTDIYYLLINTISSLDNTSSASIAVFLTATLSLVRHRSIAMTVLPEPSTERHACNHLMSMSNKLILLIAYQQFYSHSNQIFFIMKI